MTLSSEDQKIIEQGKAVTTGSKNGKAKGALTRTAKEVTDMSQAQLQTLSDEVAAQTLPLLQQVTAEKLAKGIIVSMPEVLEETGGMIRDFLPRIFHMENGDLLGNNPLEQFLPESE